MSGDPIDLDAIEARAKEPDCRLPSGARPMRCADFDIHPDAIFHCPECREARTTLALVAEVRRLSDTVERIDWLRRSTAMDCDIDGGYCDMHGVETDDEGRCGLVAMLDRALSP